MNIQILLFNGFDELDVMAPYEVLRMAQALGAPFQVSLVGLDEGLEVEAAHGVRILKAGPFRLPELDLLLVPGGGWVDRSPQGAWAEAKRGGIPRLIAEVHQSGKWVAAVCTGAMLLAEAGILKGRTATTHHGAIQDLEEKGVKVVKARVVDDGEIITAGGVTSGLDLALWLVERFSEGSIARRVEEDLEYHRVGEVWARGT